MNADRKFLLAAIVLFFLSPGWATLWGWLCASYGLPFIAGLYGISTPWVALLGFYGWNAMKTDA